MEVLGLPQIFYWTKFLTCVFNRLDVPDTMTLEEFAAKAGKLQPKFCFPWHVTIRIVKGEDDNPKLMEHSGGLEW